MKRCVLKNCPKCNSGKIVVRTVPDKKFRAICLDCGFNLGEQKSVEDAVSMWDRYK